LVIAASTAIAAYSIHILSHGANAVFSYGSSLSFVIAEIYSIRLAGGEKKDMDKGDMSAQLRGIRNDRIT